MIYERKSRRPGQVSAASKPLVEDSQQHSGVAGWERRRRAARRVEPWDCGCSDPWTHRCLDPAPSDRMVEAGRDAALHLLADGYVPLLKADVLQSLSRRGGDDRRLAELLFEAAGGKIV